MTVFFLIDECGFGGYSVATRKAVTLGSVEGHWRASKGFLLGVAVGDPIVVKFIGSIVGSTVGLAVGVKEAYDGFESNTETCGAS